MVTIIIAGVLFGVILQRSRVNTFDRIGGFAMMQDWTVPKVMLTAIAVSMVLLFVETQLGWAAFHVKPFLAGGVIGGGIVFGIGMAILGYCPGTLIVSVGEGALDALVGTIAGLIAGVVFVVLFPSIRVPLGPNLGKVQLLPHALLWGGLTVLAVAALLIWAAVKLDSFEA